ncbi:MAG: hypothetical protein CM15mP83_5890 [Flavobacteriaceae bacterium]|nr:MAG: hypothetical protein CM15mP83_5890 [Flavobacteriaceae bacterium]
MTLAQKWRPFKRPLGNCHCIDLCRYQTFDDPDQSLHQLHQTPVSFSDPIWVLFSSGTTGKPKAIVHGTGAMILEHQKALAIHQNVCEEIDILVFHNWLDDVELRFVEFVVWCYALSV